MISRGAIAPLVAALLIGLAGCDRSGDVPGGEAPGSAPSAPASSADEAAIEVETARVRRGSVLQRIAAPGSLVARRESRIGPELPGRIQRIHVEEGDRVEAGDPLFAIDPEPYDLALRRAQALLDRARAERRQIGADLERAAELHRKDVVSKQRMDTIETSLAIARAAEREAEERVALARRDLENTLVRAPYAASVAARLEDEGTTVHPQSVVLVLQETQLLEAQATIPEIHFASIREGDAALVNVEGLARPIATEVASVADVIDPTTRTYLVRMDVPNPDHELKAGVFASVEILPRAKDDVIAVPRDAIRQEDGQPYVLVVRDGRAELAPLRLGIVAEDMAEVLSGVRVDDEIVVGGEAATLGPGMRVRPRNARSRGEEPAPR